MTSRPATVRASSTARPARCARCDATWSPIARAAEDLSISGYWKRRRTEEGWREDKAEWKRQVEADLQGAAG